MPQNPSRHEACGTLGDMKQVDLCDLTLACFVYLSLHPQPSRIQLFKRVFTIITNHVAPHIDQSEEEDWFLPVPLNVFQLVRCSVEEWFDGSAPPGNFRASFYLETASMQLSIIGCVT